VRLRLAATLALVTAVVAAAAGAARAGTVLLVSGHGWGHGVGMSQWGAYGYALHGWTYRRILFHYYPGTQLRRIGEPRVRVLIAQDVSVVTVGCAARMKVGDGRGSWWRLPAGSYGVGPKLVLPLRHAGRGRSLGRVAEFQCGRAPLELDGRQYHGDLVLRSSGGLLSVVDNLPLDSYVRGVVPSEMPSHWGLAALEAQAIAARSYAVSELKPDAHYDLLPDTRDQMYGGVAAERPRTDRAVYDTAGLVLTWQGQVARAYYSSSSGGRTESVQDAWHGAAAIPYLQSVSDPYDTYSPHHAWGPFAFSASGLAARLGVNGAVSSVRLVRDRGYRVVQVLATLASGSTMRWSGEQVAKALGLQSTWFSVGELSLAPSASHVLYGHSVRLAVHAGGVGPALLQARRGNGAWRTMRHVQGTATLSLVPPQSVQYRLLVGGAATSAAVAVVPRLQVDPAGVALLRGSIQPRPNAPVLVWRWGHAGWRIVARPAVAPSGTFATRVQLKPGGYKITVGADGAYAATQRQLHVTKRLLASLPH
jgi:stage II sporulation protein D